MDFFTADWHLDHKNIIKFCDRPFNDTIEMGVTIINGCNEVMGPDDRLFHLGDVTGGRSDNYGRWLNQLTCRNLFLFPGNHDKRLRELAKFFTILEIPYGYYDYVDPDDRNYHIILHHHAIRVWPHAHHGWGHLYGHSHGKLSKPVTSKGNGAMAFDVGVDAWGFKPLSLVQVKAEFKRLASLNLTQTTLSKANIIDDHHESEDDEE